MTVAEEKVGTINIGLAGHTQVGKTTLARTLTKSNIGDILHHANSTTVATPQNYHALLATIWDCPGFQNAAQMLTYIEFQNNFPDMAQKFRAMMKGDVTFDERAVEALKECDVILYCGNLAITPDDSHKHELGLTKLVQPSVVGVLTKAGPKEHIDEWHKLMREAKVEHVVMFNAHWDTPNKVNQLYDSIYAVLPEVQQVQFLSGLERFKSRQKDLRQQACNFIVDLVQTCRTIKESKNVQGCSIEHISSVRQAMQKQVKDRIARSTAEFVKNTTQLYEIASENATLSVHDLMPSIKVSTSDADVLNSVIDGGKKSLAPGALAGGVIGGLIAGVLSGGLGAPAGAALGAGIGGTITGIFGAGKAAGSAVGSTLTVDVTDAELGTVVESCLALIWALTHHGYGFGPELSERKVNELQRKVGTLQATQKSISWTSAPRTVMIAWLEQALNELENTQV